MMLDCKCSPAGIFAILAVLVSVGSVTGQEKAPGVVVTQETYCRAETDRTFNNTTKLAGGVNFSVFQLSEKSRAARISR